MLEKGLMKPRIYGKVSPYVKRFDRLSLRERSERIQQDSMRLHSVDQWMNTVHGSVELTGQSLEGSS